MQYMLYMQYMQEMSGRPRAHTLLSAVPINMYIWASAPPLGTPLDPPAPPLPSPCADMFKYTYTASSHGWTSPCIHPAFSCSNKGLAECAKHNGMLLLQLQMLFLALQMLLRTLQKLFRALPTFPNPRGPIRDPSRPRPATAATVQDHLGPPLRPSKKGVGG